ncbi:hypothetical protein ACI8AF_06120 [Blastococcus sp. SYSU D00669]
MVVGVVGAVVSAVAGGITTAALVGGGDGAPGSTSVDTYTAQPASTDGMSEQTAPPVRPDAPASPTTAVDPWALQWGPGTVNIVRLDFDMNPPEVLSPGLTTDLNAHSLTADGRAALHMSGGSRLARWTGTTDPTASDCYRLTSTQPVDEVPAAVGDRACVLSRNGHVALVVVSSVEGSRSDPTVTASLTVWRQD